DLVLAFSDLQRDVVRDLIGAGVGVLCTNQRSFDDVLDAILLIGGALGCEARAREVIGDMQDELRQVREYSAAWPDRPRVYFEEWMDPLIVGIRWVSEAIEIAGGRDVFAELRDKLAATDRIVTPEAVAGRDPQIILASWCGKPVDPDRIARRPGWTHIAAAHSHQQQQLDAAHLASPPPALRDAVRRRHAV